VSSTYDLCDCPFAIICNRPSLGRAVAGFWSQGSPCGICDWKSWRGQVLCVSLSHFFSHTHSTHTHTHTHTRHTHNLSLSLIIFNTYCFVIPVATRFSPRPNPPSGPPSLMCLSLILSLSHTHTHTHTLSRTPLTEGSDRRTDLCRTPHNIQKRTFMPPAWFEPATPANERLQTHALGLRTTRIGFIICYEPVWWDPIITTSVYVTSPL